MATNLADARLVRRNGGSEARREPAAIVESEGRPQQAAHSMTTAEGATAIAVGLYLLLCSGLTLYLLGDVWTKSFLWFGWLFPAFVPGAEESQLLALQTFAYATGGAVLGAVILSFRGLHKYAVVLRTFHVAYSGSYLLGPWASGLLGITTYAMLRGGLLVFAGGEQGALSETSVYAYLALGIVTGFSWERMLARIDDLAKQIFGSRKLVPSRESMAGRPG
ncbi:MAG: hypothetical protein ACREH6_02365 [Geminicoccaceae bacterium]